MTFFVREAQIEENTVSECIRTLAAMYSCRILQLYEYEANEYGYEMISNDTQTEYHQFTQHKR